MFACLANFLFGEKMDTEEIRKAEKIIVWLLLFV